MLEIEICQFHQNVPTSVKSILTQTLKYIPFWQILMFYPCKRVQYYQTKDKAHCVILILYDYSIVLELHLTQKEECLHYHKFILNWNISISG